MKKTDKYSSSGLPEPHGGSGAATARSVGKMVWRVVLTFLAIFMVVGVTMGIFLFSYLLNLKSEVEAKDTMDLNALKLNYTSFIYTYDSNGNPVEYQRLYGGENNRVWVDYDKIPENMKNAMIAIEDRRFEEHNGVDWWRTIGATTTLFTKGGSYGGSTITQQLVKNLTGDNDVSITRKVTEIFRALNLEKKYTKEQLLEAYLNIVNYGAGTKGVQAAANLYFDKDISECSLAECAAIAGITQNPYKYNPLSFPENNKERQQIVLSAMLEQEKITQSEYDQAMEESEHMVFVGKKEDDDNNTGSSVFNWYTETMFSDLVEDLQWVYNCSATEAADKIYYGGLKIYSAMDPDVQKMAEDVFAKNSILNSNPALQAGFFMMDYDGRVLAVVGSTAEKTGNRVYNNAIDATLQTGSTQKAISVYAPALEKGLVNYSSLVDDEPLPNWFGAGKPGPNNWDDRYRGQITVEEALRNSLNAPAAQLCNLLTPEQCYAFLTQKLGFTHLNQAVDSHSLAAMSIGGLNGGATVREMTAAFQIFGNQGQYNKPYTYYYVEDHDGNVIIDNRNNASTQAISAVNAGVMNKLLTYAVNYGTGTMARIPGWEAYGKTGTTDNDRDSWFIGGTPYAVAGIWTGYKNPARITGSSLNAAKVLWKQVMTKYLADKPAKKFDFSDDLVAATYCESSGLLASAGCTNTGTGWYERGKLPATCSAVHASSGDSSEVSSNVSDTGESKTSEVSSGGENSSGSSSSASSSSSAPPSSSSAPSSSSTPSSQPEPPASTPDPAPSEGGGQAEPAA